MVVVPQTRAGELQVSLLPRSYAGIVMDHTPNGTVLSPSNAIFARGHTSSEIAPNDGQDAFNKCSCSYGPSNLLHDGCSYSYGPCLWKGYVHVGAGSVTY